jgi:LEA14-like dessication related protein
MNALLFRLRRLALGTLPLLLAGCATLAPDSQPKVDVVAVEPLPWQGPELRMAVRLRIINPGETAVAYDGIYVEINVDGQSFASGVTDAQGSVPRFSEAVVDVPVTVPAMALVRQAFGLATGARNAPITYQLRGKLSGPIFRSHRFESSGTLRLPTQPSGTDPSPPIR